jgi:DNA-binding NtrC family response regulator
MADGGVTEQVDRSAIAAIDPLADVPALVTLFTPDRELAERIVPLRAPLSVGRRGGPDVGLAIDDGRVSRHHATFIPTSGGKVVEVHDEHSSNGTFVNRVRVESAPAGRGSIVRLGDTIFEISVAAASPPPLPEAFIARSAAMAAIARELAAVARHDVPALLLGETGTGKEVAATAIHERSGRRGSLVVVNCPALPRDLVESTLFGHKKGAFTGATVDAPGAFVQAHGGSLFLDEVGELTPEAQAKLLRVLETREVLPVGGAQTQLVDVRVIAATNADLPAAAASDAFRRDLYARLAGYVVTLPPLRERRADILPLARRFWRRFSTREVEHTANFAEALVAHRWPLNIRELRNVVQRLVILAADEPVLRSGHLERALAQASPEPEAAEVVLAGAEAAPREALPARQELVALLLRTGGNVREIAAHYAKDRKQIYRWLSEHGLNADDYRRAR